MHLFNIYITVFIYDLSIVCGSAILISNIFFQNELDEVAHVWNAHYLQSTKEGGVRSCPSNVYLFLELIQVQDYIHPVNVEVLELCRRECTIGNVLPGDEEIFELGCIFRRNNTLIYY